VATFLFAACSNSPGEPLAVSPVGSYVLIGCSYGADTSASSIESGCGTGGSNHYEWPSGSVLVDADGTVTRSLVVINQAWGVTLLWSSTDTAVVTGTWTLSSDTLTAKWNAPSTGSMTFTRSGSDLIRENGEWNEWIYFWYRRTP
jgi:hypothetical protein